VQNIVKIMLIHRNLKIERANIDFFVDRYSHLVLISIEKVILVPLVIKDPSYFSACIFEQKYVDKQAEYAQHIK